MRKLLKNLVSWKLLKRKRGGFLNIEKVSCICECSLYFSLLSSFIIPRGVLVEGIVTTTGRMKEREKKKWESRQRFPTSFLWILSINSTQKCTLHIPYLSLPLLLLPSFLPLPPRAHLTLLDFRWDVEKSRRLASIAFLQFNFTISS